MPQNDYPGTGQVHGFEGDGNVEVAIDPTRNDGANLLAIYTGTVLATFKGNSATKWHRGTIAFEVPAGGRLWSEREQPGHTLFKGGTVVVSLAAIENRGVSHGAGWAADLAEVSMYLQPEFQIRQLRVTAYLAVKDTDGVLLRMSYQVFVKGIAP